jgi:hypothetical protein
MQTPLGEAREVLRIGFTAGPDAMLVGWDRDGCGVLMPLPNQPLWLIGSLLSYTPPLRAYAWVRPSESVSLFYSTHEVAPSEGALLFFPAGTVATPPGLAVDPANGEARAADSREVAETIHRLVRRYDSLYSGAQFLPADWNSRWGLKLVANPDGISVRLLLASRAVASPIRVMDVYFPPNMELVENYCMLSVSPDLQHITFAKDDGLWLLRLRKPIPDSVKEAQAAHPTRSRQVHSSAAVSQSRNR